MLASCSEALQEDAAANVQGTEGRVSLTLSAAPMQVGMAESRASIDESLMDEGTVATSTISDLWLIEYDAGGTQIGEPRYMTWEEFKDMDKLPILLPKDDQTEYTCVVVANTHDANALGTATVATLDSLTKQIHTLNDLYNYMPASEMADGEKCDMVMNGIFKVNSQTTAASCTLYRNVAKLRLTLKNQTGSGIKLRTVQLKDVPATMCYADQAVMEVHKSDDFSSNPFPALSAEGFIDFDTDSLGTDGKGLCAGSETTLTYYLPRNMRGETTTTEAKDRNTNAPYKATYIEILATKVDAEGNELTPVRYRFYIGSNNTSDFNVKANHLYDMPVTFTQAGAESDSRVEDMGCTKLAADANCHVITPLDLDVQQVYELPIDRANEFWNGTVYAKQLPDYNGVIDESTEWEASVLWQDQGQQMIQFCDKNGKVTASTQGLYAAKGPSTNIFFKPVKGAKGNLVLGLKKKGEETYLWSWHLWISDYNPDEVLGKRNAYETDVKGGRILRYDDGEAAAYHWWADRPNAAIMDRNIGAMSADGDLLNVKPTHGLYFQFKRKDPFPHPFTQIYSMSKTGKVEAMTQKEYSINGNTSKSYLPIKAGMAYIAESVQNPTTIYAPGGDVTRQYDWVKEGPKENYDYWITLLSPGPKGWTIPHTYVWQIFVDEYKEGLITSLRGYQCYVDKAHTIKTWYPYTWNIGTADGSMAYDNYFHNCYMWSSVKRYSYQNQAFVVNGGIVCINYANKGAGCVVRMVKEN